AGVGANAVGVHRGVAKKGAVNKGSGGYRLSSSLSYQRPLKRGTMCEPPREREPPTETRRTQRPSIPSSRKLQQAAATAALNADVGPRAHIQAPVYSGDTTTSDLKHMSLDDTENFVLRLLSSGKREDIMGVYHALSGHLTLQQRQLPFFAELHKAVAELRTHHLN
ncbi:hypothetical protein HaLaN_28378, partial [Haematococcus lacustris]